MATYKPVGVDENSQFPPRVEQHITNLVNALRAPRVFTTAARPLASDNAVGSMIYDSTLHKPIWSDGTVWRDATGATA